MSGGGIVERAGTEGFGWAEYADVNIEEIGEFADEMFAKFVKVIFVFHFFFFQN